MVHNFTSWTTLAWILVHTGIATNSIVQKFPCNIDRVDGSSLTAYDFARTYLHKRPVVLYNLPPQPTKFTQALRQTQLRKSRVEVLVSTASNRVTNVADGTNKTLSSFLKSLERRKKPKKHCVTVFDHKFFDARPDLVSDFQMWDVLSSSSFGAAVGGASGSSSMSETNRTTMLILSVGGAPSGLTFHQHGNSVLLLLEGRKRWYDNFFCCLL